MAEVHRPRPFSLAVGLAFVITGVAAIAESWTDLDAGAVGALALLVGGVAALIALTTRRAPKPSTGSE